MSALRVVIYAAKSTADKRGSIPDQIEACRVYAGAKGWEVDGKPESDESASAYTANRGAGLGRAMDRAKGLAKRHGRAGLLVWHSNRIARGAGDGPNAAKHLIEYYVWGARANVELHSVQDDATFSNPIYAAVAGEMATQESKIKGANVVAGMRRRRARRMHSGGAMYGYVRDRETGLKPNPAQAPTVERIFQLVASGKSQAETARILNAEGSKPLRGSEWVQGSLSALLQRRTYLGEIKDDDGEWVEGAHEAIVSPALWEAANREREAAAGTRGRRGGPRSKADHLLPGRMLRHASCGHAMTPRTIHNAKGEVVGGRYVCSGRKAGVCEGLRVDMDDVDATITGYLAEVGIDVEASLRLVRDAAASRGQATEAELTSARKEAATAEANFDRVRRDYMEGKITPEDWADFRPDLTSELEAARARVNRLEAQSSATKTAPEVIVPVVADALAMVRAATEAGDTDTVRAAVEALFSAFTVGEVQDVPPEAFASVPDPVWRSELRDTLAAMEAKAGRSVAESNRLAEEEEARIALELDLPTPRDDDPIDAGLWPSDKLCILPTPREDALQSIVEDGQAVPLVDAQGRTMYHRVPLVTTNNEGLST